MSDRRAFLLGAGSAAIALATLGWRSSTLAKSRFKTSSLLLQLAGVFFYPPDPCLSAGENVALTGHVHVVTAQPPTRIGSFVNIYTNMAGALGTGQTSGDLYVATGSQNFIVNEYPPEPVNGLVANFSLQPTNGCASVPLPLSFNLVFAADGTLLSKSNVSIFQPK